MSEEKEGLISKAVKVEASEGKFLVTMSPEKCEILKIPGSEAADDYKIVIAGSIFKHLFASGYDPSTILPSDIYLQFEVPANKLAKEVRLVVETGRGIDFSLSAEEVSKDDEVTKYIPKVVVKGE